MEDPFHEGIDTSPLLVPEEPQPLPSEEPGSTAQLSAAEQLPRAKGGLGAREWQATAKAWSTTPTSVRREQTLAITFEAPEAGSPQYTLPSETTSPEAGVIVFQPNMCALRSLRPQRPPSRRRGTPRV